MKPSVKNIKIQKHGYSELEKMTGFKIDIPTYNTLEFEISNSYLLANLIRITLIDDLPSKAIDIENATIDSDDTSIGPWNLSGLQFVNIADEMPVKTQLYINFKSSEKALEPVPILSDYIKCKGTDLTKYIQKGIVLFYIMPGKKVTIDNLVIDEGTGRKHARFIKVRVDKWRELDYTYVYYASELGIIRAYRHRISVADLVKIVKKLDKKSALTKRVLFIHPKGKAKLGRVDKEYIKTMDFVVDHDDSKFCSSSEVHPMDYHMCINAEYPKRSMIKALEILIDRFKYARDNYAQKKSDEIDGFFINGEIESTAHVICWYVYIMDKNIALCKFDDNYNSLTPGITIQMIHPNAKKIYESAVKNIIADLEMIKKSFF